MKVEAVRTLLRAETAKAGSQALWAEQNGIAPGYVGDVLSGRREPGKTILAPLGLEKVISYQRIKTNGR